MPKEKKDIVEEQDGSEVPLPSQNGRIDDVVADRRSRLMYTVDQQKLVEGAVAFSSELIDSFPQIHDDGGLNYYICGSLATTLIAGTESIEILDASRLPAVVITEEIDLDDEAREDLSKLIRPIADFDFTPVDDYRGIGKGGGGPSFNDLTEEAKGIFNEKARTQSMVMCDPVQPALDHDVIAVTVGDKRYFVAGPKSVVAYKAVHLGEAFAQKGKSKKFVRDFEPLLQAVSRIYSREEIVKNTHDTAFAYGGRYVTGLTIPYYHPDFSDEIRQFYDEVLQQNENFDYLADLEFYKDRWIGVLKVLAKLDTDKAKRSVVDFIRDHKDAFDEWLILTSINNDELMAKYLLSRSNLPSSITNWIEGEITQEKLFDFIQTNPWVYNQGSFLEEASKDYEFEKTPSFGALPLLMNLVDAAEEEDLEEELNQMASLFEQGIEVYHMRTVFDSKIFKDHKKRKALIELIRDGKMQLSEDRFEVFQRNVLITVSRDSEYVSEERKWRNIDIEMQYQRVIEIAKRFGLELSEE